MYKDDEHPVYQSDVTTTDGLISATDLGDVITATIDSTWIYDNTISVGGAGCVLTSTGTGEFTWSSIDLNETKIKEMLKEQRVRGTIKNGKHTPKRCYE